MFKEKTNAHSDFILQLFLLLGSQVHDYGFQSQSGVHLKPIPPYKACSFNASILSHSWLVFSAKH